MREKHRYAICLYLQGRNLTVAVDSMNLDEYVRVLPFELRHDRIKAHCRCEIEFRGAVVRKRLKVSRQKQDRD
jgi:hypothetical protein